MYMHAADVDFGPVVTVIWDYVVQVVPLLATAMIAWVAKKYGFSSFVESKLFHDMLDRAVTYGVTRVDGVVHGQPMKVEVANKVMAMALQYAMTYAPGMIEKYKVSPQDLVRLIMAHMPPVEGPVPVGTAESITAAVDSRPVSAPVV